MDKKPQQRRSSVVYVGDSMASSKESFRTRVPTTSSFAGARQVQGTRQRQSVSCCHAYGSQHSSLLCIICFPASAYHVTVNIRIICRSCAAAAEEKWKVSCSGP